MKIHVLFVLFIALILNACNKKKLPPKDEEPEPVFYFKCDIGGFPVDIEAGVNAYYMKSAYYKDTNDVYIFKGELKQKECTDNCGFGFTVLISDYKVSPNNTMHIDSAFRPMSYQYNDAKIEPLKYTGTFTPTTLMQNSSYKWSFSDGNTWNGIGCTRTFNANTKYTATMSAKSTSFGDVIHNNVYRVGNPVQTNVNVVRIAPYTAYSYQFSTPNISGAQPLTYYWDFGDGNHSSFPTPTHEFSSSGLYTTKLTVIDANHDTCESYYQVPAFNGSFGQSNFNAYFTPVQNTKALSTITILVNDPKGAVYSSHSANQPEKSNFEIISVENYQAADSNMPFKKLKIRFKCTVYNGANSIEINEGEAVIALTYKN